MLMCVYIHYIEHLLTLPLWCMWQLNELKKRRSIPAARSSRSWPASAEEV